MRDIQEIITPQSLTAMLAIPPARADKWAAPIAIACAHYGIESPLQIAAFVAQIGHESGRLRYVREIWGPTAAQRAYEGRRDLGNTQSGDGSRYRGRGLIQITGRTNYERAALALGLPLLEQPELLEEPRHAAMSAAWYWHSRHLNELADAGDMRGLTRLINGGYNGLDERLAIYHQAMEVLRENVD